MPTINIENVHLKTASIEIKALMVNNRQLTLSTFRQIPEKEIIDYDTVTLKGIPWGYVNYFWKDNGNETDCWHIVWQEGAELRRCIILKKHDLHLEQFDSDVNIEMRKFECFHCNKSEEPSYYFREFWRDNNIPNIQADIEKIKNNFKKVNNDECSEYDHYSLINFFGLGDSNLIKKNSYTTRYPKDEVENALIELERYTQTKLIKANINYDKQKEKLASTIRKRSHARFQFPIIFKTFVDLPQIYIAI
jgi:hypothetical protein